MKKGLIYAFFAILALVIILSWPRKRPDQKVIAEKFLTHIMAGKDDSAWIEAGTGIRNFNDKAGFMESCKIVRRLGKKYGRSVAFMETDTDPKRKDVQKLYHFYLEKEPGAKNRDLELRVVFLKEEPEKVGGLEIEKKK